MKGGHITAIRGTYVHRDLIVPIASWISPEFALKVSRIVQSHFAKEALDAKEAEHARIVGKKNDKIDRLSKKVDQVLDAIGYVQSQNVGLEKHLIDVKRKLRRAI